MRSFVSKEMGKLISETKPTEVGLCASFSVAVIAYAAHADEFCNQKLLRQRVRTRQSFEETSLGDL